MTTPSATSLAARNAAAPTGFDRTNAAVPRSFSVATEPIARTIAAKRAELAEVLLELVDRVGRGRCRDGIVSWSPRAALMISGRYRAVSGDRIPIAREQDHDDRQPARPPRLEELLARGASRSPVTPARLRRPPVSWRKTSSSVGRTRSHARRTASPAATIAREQLARGTRRVADRDPDAPVLDRDVADPARRAQGCGKRSSASAWPGSGSTR